ncbi:unnamed protein product [Amoebophrya sp. A120]|nr:unnamed protein product [Amoebophrya sp. A120]|eukprot:GSA120T00002689001.1
MGGFKRKVHPQVKKFAERSANSSTTAAAGKNPFDTLQNKSRNRQVLGEKRRGELRDAQKVNQVRNQERASKLLDEYRRKNKKSVIDDKRIDREHDDEYDDKRLVKLLNAKAKKSKFQLGEEQALTHGGRSLSGIADDELERDLPVGRTEIERMTREEEIAMAEANFGGGATGANAIKIPGQDRQEGRSTSEGVDERARNATSSSSPDQPKTRAEIFAEIVEKSKIAKAQEMKEQREQEMKLSEFDAAFGDLLPMLQMRGPADKYLNHTRPDDYDRQMKQLSHEKVARAQERLKTEEEMKVDRAKKLQELEQQRLQRAVEDKSLVAKKKKSRGSGDNGDKENQNNGSGLQSGEDDSENDEGDDDSSDEEGLIPLDAQTDSENEDDAAAVEDGDRTTRKTTSNANEDDDEELVENENEDASGSDEDSTDENFDFLTEQFKQETTGAEGESEWITEGGNINASEEDEEHLLASDLEELDGAEQDFSNTDAEEEDRQASNGNKKNKISSLFYPRAPSSVDPMVNNNTTEKNLPFQVLQDQIIPLLQKYKSQPTIVVKLAKRAVLSSTKQPDEDWAASEVILFLLDAIWLDLTEAGSFALLYALEPFLIELISGLTATNSVSNIRTQKVVYGYFSEKMEELVGKFEFHGKTELRDAYKQDKRQFFQSLHFAKMLLHFFPTTDVRHPLVSPMLLHLDRLVAVVRKLFAGDQETLRTALLYLRNVLFEYSNLANTSDVSLQASGLLPSKYNSEALGNTFGGASKNDNGSCTTPDRYLPAFFAVERELCKLNKQTDANKVTSLQDLVSTGDEDVYLQDGTTTTSSRKSTKTAVHLPDWVRHVGGYEETAAHRLFPLQYLKRPVVQIPMLDPVFHDPRDGALPKGDPNRTLNRKLKQEYNKERRNAAKELRKDAEFLRHVKAKEDERFVKKQEVQKKRVRAMMGVEAQDIAQMRTSHATSMDTSLGSYKRRKKEKKQNARLAGNKTNKDVGRD